jgi:hypothetical protein
VAIQLSRAIVLSLVAVVAVSGVAGCVGAGTSSRPRLSKVPSAAQTATESPTAALSPTASPSPTPTPRVFAFAATMSMTVARMDATATLLQNGKVLIAGGATFEGSESVVNDSAELYDPATGKFTRTGSMTTPRYYQTATLLSDGRVLIVGGSAGNCGPTCANYDNALSTAEIYNPATGKFSRTGSMSQFRETPSAVRLDDGRVLVYGGIHESADIYDPTTGKFTRVGTLPAHFGYSIYNHAILLPGGKVLMIAADDNGPAAMTFDPVSDNFTHSSLKFAPGAAEAADNDGPETATLLKDGRVLMTEHGYLEIYDPATGVVTDSGTVSDPDSTPGALGRLSATLLADGRVLIAGGYDSSTGPFLPVHLAFLYDPASGVQQIDPMLSARYHQTATLLSDGSVLIAGGAKVGTGGQDAIKSSELFR